jgi:dihydrodipicolinate synthase/N-acetylneuraminate lyase
MLQCESAFPLKADIWQCRPKGHERTHALQQIHNANATIHRRCNRKREAMTHGVIPVLYSFYRNSGTLDLEAHVQQIEWVMQSGAMGVTLLGLASEGASLTQLERKTLIARTARHLPGSSTLLITTRPDDDLNEIARDALETRGEVGLIVQIGRDPAPSIEQIRKISADHLLASSVKIGLQLAPGLIDTTFSAGSLQKLPDIVQRLSFMKAEYNSIELDTHLRMLGKKVDLLVGRNGQNLIDYLRIGATGVIPGVEMTGPLFSIVSDWMNGRRGDAIKRYGAVAAYVDFAMQDLDTVIDVGRAVAARLLSLDLGSRRQPSGRQGASFDAAIDFWFAQWQEFGMEKPSDSPSSPNKN